jgi:NAD(P)-dependent dehydrogenase (short-subunit alcohol dehydrogenase family)
MERDLKGKVVCVTGSARRVGRAIAMEFARQGADVVIHHHASPEEAECAAAEARSYGVRAFVVAADQADPDAVARMFDDIRSHCGRVDVLVNSAASFDHTPLLDMTYGDWQRVQGVNVGGPFLCCQQAARLMREDGRGGAIINISDNSGLTPWKSRPAHSVSKAALIMLTQVSALALAEYDIRVNCVVPGPVLHPAGKPDDDLDVLARELPLGRIGNPQDIARACVFLATNDFMTGTIMRVDGGEGVACRST